MSIKSKEPLVLKHGEIVNYNFLKEFLNTEFPLLARLLAPGFYLDYYEKISLCPSAEIFIRGNRV